MNFLKKPFVLLFTLSSLFFAACSEDDAPNGGDEGIPFVVAFETLSVNLSQIENSQDVALVYSQTANQSGEIIITVNSVNAEYGTDFTTTPEITNNSLKLQIGQGQNGNSFTFNKINANLDETVEITFTITAVDYPSSSIQGNTSLVLNSAPSLGRSYEPMVGGPNQPNQVYIDLSSENQETARRDSWDLGFYAGDEFRVTLNGSIYMAAAELESTDIDAISEADVADLIGQVAVGTFDPANEAYVDHPDGDITKTAISAISSNNENNKVYLLNLGYEVGTDAPEPGSVAVAGDARGYKKIRILRDGDNYVLQYANLNDTTHQEVVVNKSEGYNFTHFSFNTNNVVSAEPETANWDLVFTVFTNLIDGAGSYGFSDGVLHNRKGGVRSYQVSTDTFVFDTFSLTDVNQGNFELDQRAIGDNWRDVLERIIFDDRFFIVEDANGNIYKLRFLALVNTAGERGFPQFEYQLVQ